MSAHSTPVQRQMEEANAPAAGLSVAKRTLLELRLKKGQKVSGGGAIPCRGQRDNVPLSFAQELLWLLDQLNPNLSVYSVPRAMRITGPLQVEALRCALDAIVNRHEVLRTTFSLQNGQPVQVVKDWAAVEWRQADVSSLSGAEQCERVQRLVTEEALRPFDLSRDLMFRALLLKLAPEEHVLYLGTHHIASDGWSKSVLFKEMNVLYEASCNGDPSPLQDLPIQYADFAVCQRGQVGGEALTKQLAYWKQQLAGAPPLLELPADRSRPAVQTYRASFVRVVF